MENGKRLFMVLLAVVLCSCVSLEVGSSERDIYQGVDSRVFAEEGYIDVSKKEIVSPGREWIWYNSWHIVRRQPGFMGIDIGPGPYTVKTSYSEADFENYTWVHYCYYLYRGEIAEKYSSMNYDEKIEKEIKKKRGHRAHLIRIDKLGNNLYVITYRRSRGSYKKFHLREVDGYPFFHLPTDKGIASSDTGIQFIAKVARYGHGGIFYEEHPVEISTSDVLLLNPQYFSNPVEMEKIFVPFNFFDKRLIYEHPEIRKRGEEPMMIRISNRGIRIYFRKGAEIKQF